MKDSLGIATGLGGAAAVFPLTLTKLVKDVAAPGFQVTRVPTRVVESLTSIVGPTNKTANSYPMSVAPVGEGAPAELGNHITLILLRLPLGVDDSQQLINEITSSMTRVQYSFEPHATYAAIVGSAAVPSGLTNSLVDVVANKSIGQLTSVPGPSGPVTFGGVPVGGLLGWVPMTGDQSLGVCIYSCNGQVSVGIATDAGLVPEPGILARMIGEQFETFAGWNE